MRTRLENTASRPNRGQSVNMHEMKRAYEAFSPPPSPTCSIVAEHVKNKGIHK